MSEMTVEAMKSLRLAFRCEQKRRGRTALQCTRLNVTRNLAPQDTERRAAAFDRVHARVNLLDGHLALTLRLDEQEGGEGVEERGGADELHVVCLDGDV